MDKLLPDLPNQAYNDGYLRVMSDGEVHLKYYWSEDFSVREPGSVIPSDAKRSLHWQPVGSMADINSPDCTQSFNNGKVRVVLHKSGLRRVDIAVGA